jgi:peptidoglycan biosynthesis protein MviN/MurJ (putative lipid II flippase)
VLFPVSFLALFLALVLQALYQEARVLRVLLVITSTNVLLNLMLIPALGAKGAVLSQMLSSALQLAVLAWLFLGLMKHPEAISGEGGIVISSEAGLAS